MSINPVPFTLRDVDGLAVIGRTRHDLMGIRYDEGEGGNTPPAGDQPSGQQQTGTDAPWTKDNFDPDRAYRLVENLRTDLASEKTKREQAITDAVSQAQKDIVAQIASALGGGEQPETDPAKLQAKVTDLSSQIQSKDGALTTAQADLKARDLTIAILSNPAVRDANSKMLLSNEQFKTSIASVEPTDEAAITAAIHQALQANAALKATPSRSGGGEHQGATVQSLEAQLAAATKAKDMTETIRLKQQIAAARRRAAQA